MLRLSKALRQDLEVDLGQVERWRARLFDGDAGYGLIENGVDLPMTFEMSGGFGLSLARMASAIVTIQATRPANSSAAGSGLTARYSVPTSLS